MDEHKFYNEHCDKIHQEIFEEFGWKGKGGCFCHDCWKWCKKGSYDEWLVIYRAINKKWEEEEEEEKRKSIEFDTFALDEALYKDELDWTREKPSHNEYTTIYIIKKED